MLSSAPMALRVRKEASAVSCHRDDSEKARECLRMRASVPREGQREGGSGKGGRQCGNGMCVRARVFVFVCVFVRARALSLSLHIHTHIHTHTHSVYTHTHIHTHVSSWGMARFSL
jgi:hypothetical protein